MTIAFFLFAAFMILVLVSGGYAFFTACLRRKDLPWLDKQALQKTPYGRFSEHIQAADRWLTEHRAQEVSITSEDGLTLRGWWVPAEEPRGTMLLVHGYRSCALADFGPALDFYHNMGMNMLLPFQRSHGKSEGKYITFGVKESRDMLRWIDFHNQTFGKQPMLLSGLSMGASTVMYMAEEPLPANVKGIIADCGFTSPKEIISSVFRKTTHLPAVPTIWVVDLFARMLAGFSLYEKDSCRALAKSRLPILMIHGTKDSFVPCDMTKKAFECCVGNKQLLLIEGATHGVSFLHDKKRYTGAVINFLNTNIPLKGE